MIRAGFAKVILVGTLCAQLTWAQAPSAGLSNLTVSEELSGASRGNEYVSGNYPGAILMPVNLWGAVPKPGIHHIPAQTDLLTFLSFAGGPSKDAALDEVSIKRRVKGKDDIIAVNLKNVLTKPGQLNLALEPNDIVLVPQKEEGFSNSTMKTVTVISLVVGIVLTGLLISDHISPPTR